ncbi:M4 family peptidase, partial [Streptomyces sp. AC154]
MLVGQGIAAVLAAAGLLVTAIPAAHADTATASTASEVTAGAETETPSLVTGLNEEVAATGTAADAARGHLRARKSRYHITDTSAKDLVSAGTTTDKGGKETVRLQQKYQGVRVLGGQYLVRMARKDGKRTVTGTSGNYFTKLKLGTVTPKISEKTAIERAIGAVSTQLGGGLLHAPAKDGQKLTGTAEGVTILPQGAGVLTRQITVTGISPVDGQPVKQQVYIDAHSGFPVMQYSDIKTFGATDTATPATAGPTGTTPQASP